ncbi:E1/E4 protein [Human papillomavirus type 222]|uniref:E1/E4 protein n=1 Tax=Human papillomavirus type 222 TaxID=2200959 RepID=A0A2S1ZRY4_9PAPI|nr:E1/E4 protein [Human papillomavirus type 222]
MGDKAPHGLQRTPPGGSAIPPTPNLQRKSLDDKKRTVGLRMSGPLLPRPLIFPEDDEDEESNKENLPPPPAPATNDDELTQEEERQVQRKLDDLIKRLKDDICLDLDYYRRRLGTHT